MRKMGGEGHPGAGAAVASSDDAESVHRKVMELVVDQMNRPPTLVRDIVSQPEASVSPRTPVREVCSMVDGARTRAVLVLDDGRFCGLISSEECRKAKTDSQLRAPAKAFMRAKIPLISPDHFPREALRIMTKAEIGVLPAVDGDGLAGVVTRADLMLHLYEF